jgi:hypothetical protein
VDELQKRLDEQAERIDKLSDENKGWFLAWNEQQKRLDAVKQLIEEYRDPPTEDKTFQHALSIVADELEQALKGGGE